MELLMLIRGYESSKWLSRSLKCINTLKDKIWSECVFLFVLWIKYLIYISSTFDLSSTLLTNSQLFEPCNRLSRLRLRNTVPRTGKNSNNFAILFEEIRFFEARTSSTLPQFTFHRTHHRQRPPFIINMSNYLC